MAKAFDTLPSDANSLPVTSIAVVEALAIRHQARLTTTSRCSPASSHLFAISTETLSFPGPVSRACWHCGYTDQIERVAFGSCACGVTLCEPCWLRLTESAEIMVDIGEVSRELINGALEILMLDRENEGKKAETKMGVLQNREAGENEMGKADIKIGMLQHHGAEQASEAESLDRETGGQQRHGGGQTTGKDGLNSKTAKRKGTQSRPKKKEHTSTRQTTGVARRVTRSAAKKL